MASRPAYCRVVLPVPLSGWFDYRIPDGFPELTRGQRVRVPFGRRRLIGLVDGLAEQSDVPEERIQPLEAVLDQEPLLPASLYELLAWAAEYYQHPLGEALFSALPVSLRRGMRMDGPRDRTEARGPAAGGDIQGPALTPAQQRAVDHIQAALGRYRCHLLRGITGSGKTEVYLRVIAEVVRRGGQALYLVPEIGLTPQLVARIVARFPEAPLAVLHSGLSERERRRAWLAARAGQAAIVVGARSAVFTPLDRLGLIVIDEEHDPSYKQQDGFRYSARDLAVVRAQRSGVPVVLGSATPSLESLHNAQSDRYDRLDLPERTGSARLPAVRLLDMRRVAYNQGFSQPLVAALRERLTRGEQSLLFLNRRGFAPVLMCHACGWLAPCRRCDARLTLHVGVSRLRCHHCGVEALVPALCPACGHGPLHGLGEGTEGIEVRLRELFPAARIERIDRDTTRRRGELAERLARVDAGAVDILIGTQMIAKGHDFPRLTLVGVINAEQGLYSADFRAPERMVQQLAQVAGRAGRAESPGEVLIQTWNPLHPTFQALLQHDYLAFAGVALDERRQAGFPPFSHLALLRAEAPGAGKAMAFLTQARAQAEPVPEGVQVYEPLPSPMERRAGRYRAQLLARSPERRLLQEFLASWLKGLRAGRLGRTVRWSVDVDPHDLY